MEHLCRIPLSPFSVLSFAEKAKAAFSFVRIFPIGYSTVGYPLFMFSIGHGPLAHLVVGTHHAMESITGNLLLRFLLDVGCACKIQNHPMREFVKTVLPHRTLYLLPLLNPDGTDVRLRGADAMGIYRDALLFMNGSTDFTKWQSNIRGVDLNHNYDAAFLQCKKAEQMLGIVKGGPTRYGGPFPESENETKALAAFTRKKRGCLRTVTALHTQGEEIYWDFQNKRPKSAKMLADRMAAVSGYRVCNPPSEASFGGYKDYVIDKFSVPSFTVECGKGENPLSLSDFDGIYEKLLPILQEISSF